MRHYCASKAANSLSAYGYWSNRRMSWLASALILVRPNSCKVFCLSDWACRLARKLQAVSHPPLRMYCKNWRWIILYRESFSNIVD